MLPQLLPRAKAVLPYSYEPRAVKGWVGQVGEGLNGVGLNASGSRPCNPRSRSLASIFT